MSVVTLLTFSTGERVVRVTSNSELRQWYIGDDKARNQLWNTMATSDCEKYPIFAVMSRSDNHPLRIVRIDPETNVPQYVVALGPCLLHRRPGYEHVHITVAAFRSLVLLFADTDLLERVRVCHRESRAKLAARASMGTLLELPDNPEDIPKFLERDKERYGIKPTVDPTLLLLAELTEMPLPVFAKTEEFIEWATSIELPIEHP